MDPPWNTGCAVSSFFSNPDVIQRRRFTKHLTDRQWKLADPNSRPVQSRAAYCRQNGYDMNANGMFFAPTALGVRRVAVHGWAQQ